MLDPPTEFDDYIDVRPLGRGQMGKVYRAEDSVLARPVVIKFIAAVEPDVAARTRFLTEARAAARIQHPNVVSIYRVGELGDRPFIVSELVRGRVLADLPPRMPSADVLRIGIELARGLAAAHRRGVVHCDIKPSNVIIDDDGAAKLFDFGLARLDGARGEVAGTPDYMAPEVWAGTPPTRRADVYSLGAVLYELAAGAPPFAGIEAAQLRDVVTSRPAPPLLELVPDADPRLARFIDRCLARDPAQRPAGGDEVRHALEPLARTGADSATADGTNPYRGLRPFEAGHRSLFFGRAAEVGAVIDRLRVEPMVLLTGDSGVGKSSLCRAGVLPMITEGALGDGREWTAITLVPGQRPLIALATALGDPALAPRLLADPEALPRELHRRAGGGGLLLFVDQLEELVTVADPAEVAALDVGLARLSERAGSVRVVATVRADFLSRFAALPLLGQELARLLYFVRPMPPAQLREVIVGPAAANDVSFESQALVDTLVEATAAAGSVGLPLLSFALAALWEARDADRRVITDAALAAMGGVAGALAGHADAVIGELSAARRGQARQLLCRLVTSLGTRVRRTATELNGAGGSEVLDALVRGRLLAVHTLDGETVYELAHEILVHRWATLREWLDHDAEDLARHERLTAAAVEWTRLGRRGDATWSGERLAEAIALDRRGRVLSPTERAFIRASQAHVRRRRWAWRVLVLAVAAIVIGVYAGQWYMTRRRVAQAVAVELGAARGALRDARTAADQHHARAAEAFARFDASASDDGERAWSAALELREAAGRAFRDATSRLEAALARDPARRDVRRLLAATLYERAVFLEHARALDERDELIARLPAYDLDGSLRRRWSAPGTLTVDGPAGAEVTLEGRGRLGVTPLTVELPAGAHVIAVAAPGRVTVRHPIEIERGATASIAARLPSPADVPPGFVHVPAGVVQFGTRADDETRRGFFFTVPMHPREVPAFLVAVHEVTFAEWFEFVDSLDAATAARRTPAVPSKLGTGSFAVERGPDGWSLVMQPMETAYRARWGEPLRYEGRTVRQTARWGALPVVAVSAEDAVAYAGWLDRTGRVPGARLCSELEWERAARGADARLYPHGNRLAADDANIDATYGRERMGPDEVGSHPGSRSPFGVDDLAGNAFEWTTATIGEGFAVRGGSYFHDAKTARIANRQPAGGSLRDATVGFRLCATPRPTPRSTDDAADSPPEE